MNAGDRDAPDAADAPVDPSFRRCVATGRVLPKAALVRFVVAPDGVIVADVAGRLPGRGLWLVARRDIVAAPRTQGALIRAAMAAVGSKPTIPADLADRVEALLARRCTDCLGLARRAGQAKVGFDTVKAWLESGRAAVLVAARDGAANGRTKLRSLAPEAPLVELLDSAEIGAAFGRGAVVHAALARGRLADQFLIETGRLAGFRSGAGADGTTDRDVVQDQDDRDGDESRRLKGDGSS